MRLIAALLALAAILSAQTRTTLKGVLNSPGTGLRVSCAMTATLSGVTTSVTVAGGTELAPTKYSSMLTGGSYSFQLVPNDAITPSGTYYSAAFSQCDTGEAWTETWVVPTSATPLTISAVRAAVPASPSMAVSPAQLTSGGATSGQGLVWNGTTYVPTTLSGSGTVTSVSCGTFGASWLTCSFGVNPTTTPILAIGAATGQASHQVIGTCGSATSFGPCALQAADIPALAYAPWPSGSTAGVPYYSGSSSWGSTIPTTTVGAINSVVMTDSLGNTYLGQVTSANSLFTTPSTNTAGPYSSPIAMSVMPGAVGNFSSTTYPALGNSLMLQGGQGYNKNTSSRGGDLEVASGQSILGLPGLLYLGQSYYAPSGPINMACLSGAMTAVQCGASPTSSLGAVDNSQLYADAIVMLPGSTSIVHSSNAATVGHTVCLGAASPSVTDSGGTAPCGAGQGFTVGQVVATSGSWLSPSGGGGTASSTNPLVHLWKTWSEGKGDLPSTMVATDQSNAYTTGTQDSSAATHTIPARVGVAGSKPSTCTLGEMYFATDATAGQNWYYCTATSTWTQQVAGGGGGTVTVQNNGSAPLTGIDTINFANGGGPLFTWNTSATGSVATVQPVQYSPASLFGAYSARPTCTTNYLGSRYYASEVSNKHWECDGATWQPVAFDMQVVEPTGLTWATMVGAGSDTPTITNAAGTVQLAGVNAAGAGYNFQGMLTPISISTPYTIEVAFTMNEMATSYSLCQWGVASGNSPSSSFLGPGWQVNFSSVLQMVFAGSFNSIGGAGRGHSAPYLTAQPVIRSKMVDDGTNRQWYFNIGSGYQLWFSEGDTIDVSPASYWGIGCTTYATGEQFQLTLYHASVHH